MSMNDPLADMLTRIRNATLRKHETVNIPHSKIKESVARLLVEEGFAVSYHQEEKLIKITLKYDKEKKPVIRKIERVSKPGLRIYKGFRDIKPKINGQGIYIISTSKGIMADIECREKKIGGEILCSIY